MQILKSMHNCYNGSLYIQGIKIQFLQFKNAQNVNELIFNISLLLCQKISFTHNVGSNVFFKSIKCL